MKSLSKLDYFFIIMGVIATIFIAISIGKISKSDSYNTSYSSSSNLQSTSKSKSSNQNVSDADYENLLRAGKEFDKACAAYNHELDIISNKVTSSAYSGVNAQKIFWDCDDAFQLVERKGAAFAKAMRKCGQKDNARELERRLKADKRKYQSFKDEVNHMTGVY